jgi:hypothetical protein
MVPRPIDQNLLVCYHAIFGISDIRSGTLSQLTKWPQFLAAHATRDPAVPRHDWYEWHQIVTLFDFQTEYGYVLAAFERYNFLQQYRELFGHTPGYQHEHVEVDIARLALGELYARMAQDGFGIVSRRIDGLIRQYGTPNRDLDNQIWRWLSGNPDRPPVDIDSRINTQPPWTESERPVRGGKENRPPQHTRLPNLLGQMKALA